MGETILTLGMLWGVHLSGGGVLSAVLAVLGSHRVKWRLWELLAFVIPFSAWLTCSLLTQPKGIFQPVFEAFGLGLCVPVAALVRLAFGKPKRAWALSASLIGVLTFLAIAISLAVPRVMPSD